MILFRALRSAVATTRRRASARLLLLLAWCAAAGHGSAAQVTSADSASIAPASAAARRAAAVAVGVGDRVRLRVWRESTMSDDVTVDDRGLVTLPRLGPVALAGYSIAAARDTLLARYAVYLKNPSIDVAILRRVGVQGEVKLPNIYYIDATKSIREAVNEAGGPTETANRDHIAVVRDGHTVAVGRWDDGGPVGVDLRSGDQVIVARRSWASLNALAIIGALGVIVPLGLSLSSSLKK